MKRLLLCALLVVTASCASREVKPPPAADTVKPGAPTTLEAQLGEGSAKLGLRFDGAGENVFVVVSGLEGVTVTSPPELLSGASIKAGEVRRLEVTFTRGAGRGQLVISVRGSFGGAASARVHTVAVGEGPLPDDGAKKQVTDDGDAVKVMP